MGWPVQITSSARMCCNGRPSCIAMVDESVAMADWVVLQLQWGTRDRCNGRGCIALQWRTREQLKHCNSRQTIALVDGALQWWMDRLHKGYNGTLQYSLVGRATVNGAPLEYGSYHKRCNKVPCTLLNTGLETRGLAPHSSMTQK